MDILFFFLVNNDNYDINTFRILLISKNMLLESPSISLMIHVVVRPTIVLLFYIVLVYSQSISQVFRNFGSVNKRENIFFFRLYM